MEDMQSVILNFMGSPDIAPEARDNYISRLSEFAKEGNTEALKELVTFISQTTQSTVDPNIGEEATSINQNLPQQPITMNKDKEIRPFDKTNIAITLVTLLVAFVGVVIALNAFVFSSVSSNNAATLAAVQATNQSGADKMTAIATDINANLIKMDAKIDALNTHIQSVEANMDQKLELHDTQNELKTLKMMQGKESR